MLMCIDCGAGGSDLQGGADLGPAAGGLRGRRGARARLRDAEAGRAVLAPVISHCYILYVTHI